MILFLRSNPVVSDSRVEKEVRSLTSRGFSVNILAWDREGNNAQSEYFNGVKIVRFKLPVQYQKLVIIAFYPFFWLWLLHELLKANPKVIHACDLDTVLPAFFYRFLKPQSKVVFDVFDNYGLMIEEKSAILGYFVKASERIIASMPDALIVVSEEREFLFDTRKPVLREILINSPPDLNFTNYPSENHHGIFRIVYAGTLSAERGLLELAEAIKAIKNVEMVLAGRVVDPKLIQSLSHFQNITYVGEVNFDQALRIQREADLIPIIYDPTVPINEVAAPNKLFEAMMLGIPVISTVCKKIILENDCGLFVTYSPHDIKEKIMVLLADPKLRKRMGDNGHQAFKNKYNWEIVEKRLFALYDRLI